VAESAFGPLYGVRVLDLGTGVAGAYAAKLLADAGASVLDVEPPGGNPLRGWSASGRSLDDAGDGLLFRYLHTSRRACTLDLERDADRARLLALYEDADLVLSRFPAGFLEARSIGYEALAARNPRATLITLSPFGSEGPWRDRPANDFTLQAWCGSTASRGRPGVPPVQAGGEPSEWMAGSYAAVGALAALRRADLSGRGDCIDISQLEAVTPTLTNYGSVWGSLSGDVSTGASEDVPSIEPTSDGWVGFCLFTGQQWLDFLVMIERPDLAEDASIQTMAGRYGRGPELREVVRAYTRRHTTAEVLERCELLRVPAAPIGNGQNLPEMEHFAERGSFVRNPRGEFLQPRIPYRAERWAPRAFESAPLPPTAAEPAQWREVVARPPRRGGREGATQGGGAGDPARPLEGLRVLDATAFWAGPYAAFVLSTLGADVIHVESIQRPDGMRFGTTVAPSESLWWETGPTFHAANTGKRSITLDLSRPEGIELFLGLAAQSDLVLENYSPRVLENFGLSQERLASVNPDISLIRMPAFGLDGPWRNRGGFAQTIEQVSGVAWLTGYDESAGDQAGPFTPRAAGDPLAGLHAAFAALLATHHAEHGNPGGLVESVMVETSLAMTAETVMEYDVSGMLVPCMGNRSLRAVPQGLYPCAGGEGCDTPWLALSIEDDEEWRRLADLMGRSDWSAEPGLATREGRRERHDELDAGIAAWSREQGLDQAVRELQGAALRAAPVVRSRLGDTLEVHAGSHFYEEQRHPVTGVHRLPALPLRFGRAPGRWFDRPAPTLGEHNDEVLGGLLGLSEADLAKLREAQVIGEHPLGLGG
jgi:crotonobetainyl-CoA:carnitine CoA-transferase CaiB-like acyl-CoA transferase